MVVSTTGFKQNYVGDGSSVSLSFPHYFIEKEDVKITLDGVTQTLNVHYTIAGSGPFESGANIVFNTAPAIGLTVAMVRETEKIQPYNLQNIGKFNQEEIEDILDRMILIVQEATGSEGILAALGYDGFRLPVPSEGKLLKWVSGVLVNTTVEEGDIVNAVTYAAAALASQIAANASAVSAAAQVVLATAQVALAVAARDKAEKWADEAVDTEVETGQYSAKHHAEYSRLWANETEDTQVDATNYPGEYSSKHWQEKAKDEADRATNILNDLQSTLTGNLIAFEEKNATFTPIEGGNYKVDSTSNFRTGAIASTPNGEQPMFFVPHNSSWEDENWEINLNGKEAIASTTREIISEDSAGTEILKVDVNLAFKLHYSTVEDKWVVYF